MTRKLLSLTFVALLVSLCNTALRAAELTAIEVMTRADSRYDGDTSIADYSMVLIDRRER